MTNQFTNKLINMVGERFGRLTVIALARRTDKDSIWLCKCDCGTFKKVRRGDLRKGNARSCGCFRRERMTRHGLGGKANGRRRHPLYRTWANIVQRCTNPTSKDYPYYGGRGIRIAPQWRANFAQFLRDVGEKPDPDLSIDRINNDGNYEPGNVRWATKSEQRLNQRGVVT